MRRTLHLRLRAFIAAAVAVGALAVLSVVAGASWATGGSSDAFQYQYKGKVTICHHTHSKKHPWVTITISRSALNAHLKHGDTLGPCSAAQKHAGKHNRAHHKGHGKHHHHYPTR
jgi:hypothetical protein